MAWIVGIDEAGYGPNLGPLVMTAVAVRVPEALAAADLWTELSGAVRRHPSEDDGRLLIEDSKVVYSAARGLAALERGVLGVLPFPEEALRITSGLLDQLCPPSLPELLMEPWYRGTTELPAAAKPEELANATAAFRRCCAERQVACACVRSGVMCPGRFNLLLDRWGSKGAALAEGLAELSRFLVTTLPGDDALHFTIDKHGGRNNYAAVVQNAFPDGMVLATEEGMARSSYTVLGLGRAVGLTMRPRADAEHFCVALASMVSKYVREILMCEFNAFWQARVPGLRPTAGYPGDAQRFFDTIRPVAEQIGLPLHSLWRRK